MGLGWIRHIRTTMPIAAPPFTADRLLTADEACMLLSCSRTKLYTLRRSGSLSTVYLGRTIRFRQSDLLALIDSMTVQAGNDLADL